MRRFLMWGGILGLAVGVAYLATLGCCYLMASSVRGVSLVDQLNLSAEQRSQFAQMERQFLAQKQMSCQVLCAKRAQIIELLKQPSPDRVALAQLAEEVGQEQTVLEKATLDHLLAVSRQLQPAQRGRLMALVTEDLRTACLATACGMTPTTCFVRQGRTDSEGQSYTPGSVR